MKHIPIYLFVFQLFTITAISQKHITSNFKDYSFEVFNSKNISKLELKAQHADINLMNWDKDSVSIETTLEVLTENTILSNDLLRNVSVETKAYQKTLLVKTKVDPEFTSTIPYKITYTIFVPDNIALSIKNSHGIVKIENIKGSTNADLSYCQLDIRGLTNETDSISNNLHFQFCKGMITNLGSSNMIVNNSSINIYEANNIHLTSKYSILKFADIRSMEGKSYFDNLNIGTVQNVDLQGKNGIISIDKFLNIAKIVFTDSKVSINNSSQSFSLLTINNSNTSTKVHLNKDASYSINGEITKGIFIHPQSSELQIIVDNDKTSITGYIGKNEHSSSKIIIFNCNENIEFK